MTRATAEPGRRAARRLAALAASLVAAASAPAIAGAAPPAGHSASQTSGRSSSLTSGRSASKASLKSVLLVGHGDGPGIGMGQWGAFGYAVRYHFDYDRILDHFYGGTHLATLSSLSSPTNPIIQVVILENLDLATNLGYDTVVTSPSSFTVAGQAGPPGPPPSTTTTTTPSASSSPPVTTATTTAPATTTATGTAPATTTATGSGTQLTVPAGGAIDLRLEANGTWSAFEGTSCASTSQMASAPGGVAVASGLVDPVVSPGSGASGSGASGSGTPERAAKGLLTLCRHDGVDEPMRGSIEAYDREGYERTLNLVPLQSYLDGVVPAEVSASWGLDGTAAGAPQGRPWGFQALEAQAVAARSYVLASSADGGWQGYADICDTTLCQAYVGASYERSTSDAAVAATAGQVRVSDPASGASGTIVSTSYSASSGGWTAPSAFPAVADLGDACVVRGDPLECNPVHTWTASLSGPQLSKAFPGLGRVEAIRVVKRDRRGPLGGRALEVVVEGASKDETLGADAFSSDLGLYSDWFAVARLTRSTSPAQPSPIPTTTTAPAATVPTATTVPISIIPTTTGSVATSTAAASARRERRSSR